MYLMSYHQVDLPLNSHVADPEEEVREEEVKQSSIWMVCSLIPRPSTNVKGWVGTYRTPLDFGSKYESLNSYLRARTTNSPCHTLKPSKQLQWFGIQFAISHQHPPLYIHQTLLP